MKDVSFFVIIQNCELPDGASPVGIRFGMGH
jgi:hypothetical protein